MALLGKISNVLVGAIAIIFLIYILVGAVDFIGIVVRAVQRWLVK
jgi:hypothetical protein